jgi:hypothetical protein
LLDEQQHADFGRVSGGELQGNYEQQGPRAEAVRLIWIFLSK